MPWVALFGHKERVSMASLRFEANVNDFFLPSNYVYKVCVIFRAAYLQVCLLQTFSQPTFVSFITYLPLPQYSNVSLVHLCE